MASSELLLPPHFAYVILLNVLAPYLYYLYLRHAGHDHADFLGQCVFYIPMSIIAGLHEPLTVAVAGFAFIVGTAEVPDDDFGQVKYCGLLAIVAVLVHFSVELLQTEALGTPP